MNIRCAFCQTPYTLSRVEMLDALQEIDSKNLTHYDAHCPRCRRATQIPRQRLEMAMPNWREELKQFEVEMKEHPQHEAPPPAPEGTPAAQTESAPEAKANNKSAAKAKTSSPKAKASAQGAKKSAAASSSKEKKTTKKSK
jgi:hypothetical protein